MQKFILVLLIALLKLLRMKDQQHFIKVNLSFYSGTLTPLLGTGMLGSIRFGVFEWGKNKIAAHKNIHPS